MAARASFMEAPRHLAISEEDLQTYLDVTMDDNPAHRDADVAAQRGLPNVIVPGGLLVTAVERFIREAYSTVTFQSFKARFTRPVVLGQSLIFHARIAKRSVSTNGAEHLILRVKVCSDPDWIMAILDADILVS